MLDTEQLNRIKDPDIKRVVQQLANLLEQALAENDALKAENQRLKDEINRLKGEQGKPNVKPNKPRTDDQDNWTSPVFIDRRLRGISRSPAAVENIVALLCLDGPAKKVYLMPIPH